MLHKDLYFNYRNEFRKILMENGDCSHYEANTLLLCLFCSNEYAGYISGINKVTYFRFVSVILKTKNWSSQFPEQTSKKQTILNFLEGILSESRYFLKEDRKKCLYFDTQLSVIDIYNSTPFPDVFFHKLSTLALFTEDFSNMLLTKYNENLDTLSYHPLEVVGNILYELQPYIKPQKRK